MKESQVIRSKKAKRIVGSKFIIGSNFCCSTNFLSHYRYFIETTTTDIDMRLQLLLQFCNNNGFAAIYDVIIFCLLLDN